MSRYITKYKNKYRVVAMYDQATNDYPRTKDGNIDSSFEDIIIKCHGGNFIYYYGRKEFVAVIPSTQKGHNVVKTLYENLIGDISKFITITSSESGEKKQAVNWNSMFKDLEKKKLLFSFEETDAEFFFHFKDEMMDSVCSVLKPLTIGAGTSPFSVKNLPKTHYQIPEQDLAEYKKLVEGMKMLIIGQLTKNFPSYIATKKNTIQDIKADMKLKGLKGKEYIHSIGKWKEYLDYIKNNISTY